MPWRSNTSEFASHSILLTHFVSTGIRETAGASSSSSVPSTPAAVAASKSSADVTSFPGRKMTQKGSSRSIEIPMSDADDNKYGRQTLIDRIGVTYVIRLSLSETHV